jgi:hypothetical protein
LGGKGKIGLRVALKVEVERRKVTKRKKKQKNCFEHNLDAKIVESWVIGRIA